MTRKFLGTPVSIDEATTLADRAIEHSRCGLHESSFREEIIQIIFSILNSRGSDIHTLKPKHVASDAVMLANQAQQRGERLVPLHTPEQRMRDSIQDFRTRAFLHFCPHHRLVDVINSS